VDYFWHIALPSPLVEYYTKPKSAAIQE